jgi:hypothetical protein
VRRATTPTAAHPSRKRPTLDLAMTTKSTAGN